MGGCSGDFESNRPGKPVPDGSNTSHPRDLGLLLLGKSEPLERSSRCEKQIQATVLHRGTR